MGAQDTGDLLGANTLTGSLARFGGAIRGFSDVHHFSAYLSTGGRGWVGLREKIKACTNATQLHGLIADWQSAQVA